MGEATIRRTFSWRFWPIILPILLGTTLIASRSMGKDPDGSGAADSASDPKIASVAPGGLTPIELASRLEVAKQQEQRLDIELRSGKSYIRCKLLRLDRAGASGPPKILRVETEEASKPLAIEFGSIRSVAIGREKMYEAPVDKKSARDLKAEKEAKAAAEFRSQWVARALKHGVQPWPELTNDEHEATIEENGKQIEKIKSMIPDVAVYETAEFTFCSNIPREQVGPYVSSLDRMYDMLSVMYGIKKGTPVWRGKCLVAAFVEKSQFQDFERTFFRSAPESAYGVCHQLPNGRVVVGCYRGTDRNNFAEMLVHETSHGFIFRYRTQRRLPSWIDEGMAEWIGQTLVPDNTAVRRKEQASLLTLRGTHSMQGIFDSDLIIQIPNSYGIASSLTTFMVRADQKKYVAFINGIKEGKTWQESLKDSYNATPEQLVTEYGRAIGIPGLQP
jgi:hypothetical protein